MMDRRNLLTLGAAAAAMPVAIALPAAAGAGEYAAALREFHAIDQIEKTLSGPRHDLLEWRACKDRQNRFLSMAEALPNTPENAKIKALAFKSIYRDDMEDFLSGENTTDKRLALQIVQSLLGSV
mgnify:CR=1 FL=1|tara:strand:+ start:5634 stop:6008 length:375 start_codon:yes stop_codon:yes gene_type:complete